MEKKFIGKKGSRADKILHLIDKHEVDNGDKNVTPRSISK